jgi:hypothetical protein
VVLGIFWWRYFIEWNIIPPMPIIPPAFFGNIHLYGEFEILIYRNL